MLRFLIFPSPANKSLSTLLTLSPNKLIYFLALSSVAHAWGQLPKTNMTLHGNIRTLSQITTSAVSLTLKKVVSAWLAFKWLHNCPASQKTGLNEYLEPFGIRPLYNFFPMKAKQRKILIKNFLIIAHVLHTGKKSKSYIFSQLFHRTPLSRFLLQSGGKYCAGSESGSAPC